MISPSRRGRYQGDTDSERLFQALLSRFEAEGVTPADLPRFREVFVEFFRELRAREGLGSFNVVLSDGRHVWAHRAGRTLAVLRRPSDSPCGAAIMIASEELTDEPWTEVPDGTVVEIVGGTTPQISVLDGTFAF